MSANSYWESDLGYSIGAGVNYAPGGGKYGTYGVGVSYNISAKDGSRSWSYGFNIASWSVNYSPETKDWSYSYSFNYMISKAEYDGVSGFWNTVSYLGEALVVDFAALVWGNTVGKGWTLWTGISKGENPAYILWAMVMPFYGNFNGAIWGVQALDLE